MRNYREATVQTLRGEPPDTLVFQPRLAHWYWANRLGWEPPPGADRDDPFVWDPSINHRPYGTDVPPEYAERSLLEIHRDLEASVRKPEETLGVTVFETEVVDDDVTRAVERRDDEIVTTYETPAGTVRQVEKWGHPHERFIETVDDLEPMIHIMEATDLRFVEEGYRIADEAFGDLGIPQPWSFRSPFMMFMVEWVGFERATYLMNDHPDEVDAFLDVAFDAWEPKLDALLESPVEVISFAENVDAGVISPATYEEYLLPYYERAVDRIHDAGKVCHAHFDGNLKPLLPYLDESGFDGIEAATPEPMGDVTIEELADAMGETVLLDGVPATLFTPEYSRETLRETVEEVVDRFSPQLVLGISDMLPADGEIERVAYVADLVEGIRQERGI